jgi:hypothetical protein
MPAMMKTMKAVVLALAVLAFAPACKKKDDAAKTDDKAAAGGDMKKDDKMAKPAEGAPPAAGGGAINSDADYEATSNELMEKMTKIFTDDNKDCAKLATDVNKFIDDNKAKFDAAGAYDKAHPDEKKAYDTKAKAKIDAFTAAATPAMDACKDNKELSAAMAKLPPE